jgi:hypothetical protein
MYVINYTGSLPPALRVATIAALLIIGFTIFDLLGRAAYTLVMSASVIPISIAIVIAALVTLRVRRVA